jgi:hypothetical protein
VYPAAMAEKIGAKTAKATNIVRIFAVAFNGKLRKNLGFFPSILFITYINIENNHIPTQENNGKYFNYLNI